MIVLNNRSSNIIDSETLVEDLLYQNYVEDQKEYIDNPKEEVQKLKNIEEAIEIFKSITIDLSRTVAIIVDSDVDGYTSASLLYKGLKRYNPNLNIQYYIHNNRSHGLTSDISLWDELKDISLLIVPDAGSDNSNERNFLWNLGIPTIVLDHHSDITESDGTVIVNPYLDDYPNKYLSGVGVVYKFLKELEIDLDDLMDFVAIGIISDGMDIRMHENKSIINKGFKSINHALFKEMLPTYPTITDVMFKVAPLINALIRVGSFEVRNDLFKAMIGNPTKDQVELLMESMKYCKIQQEQIVNEIVKTGTVYLDDGIYVLLVNYTDIKTQNTLGLIANSIQGNTGKTTIVVTNNDNNYSGSCRSPFNIKSYVENIEGIEAKGHSSSFGISFTNLEVMDTLNEQIKEHKSLLSKKNIEYVNYMIERDEINQGILRKIAEFNKEYSGRGINPCKLYIEGIYDTPAEKRNNTLIGIVNGVKLIKFNATNEEKLITKTMDYTIVCKPDINVYEGREYIQLIISNILKGEKRYGR